ncbi:MULTISPECIES: glycosyltransferase family 4 protein [Chryseobacterium]|uniref:Glycogen synthase n=1 Tax=Chryseobacterium taihuense TaxID=1141221 RepID=A0A4U8WG52_9FLAO|nr:MULTISPECIES: glycosyltransferase family 4 protein [Chryseobacterium]QQV02036.1 glycosyltransferase family 4 protein [Chryseobacterium sp. FDAARGOS 1104]VFB04736.1 Glycogen synthase [Chryseobacterium taihuense]
MKKVNHVLIVTKEFQSEFQLNSGGTGIFYQNLAEGLVRNGIRVSVFGSSKKPFKQKAENLSVFFVKDYFKKNKLAELLRSVTGKISFLQNLHFKIYNWEINYLQKELKNFIRNKKIDIIETHDWEGMSRVTEDLNIPYIIRCHGSWSVLHNFFGYGAAKGKIDNEKKAFEKANYVITISKSNEKIVKQVFGAKNYHLIYNGIDTDFFRPQQNITIKPKSIFYIGNVSVEKGAQTALNAFIKVNQSESAASLNFIGRETEIIEQLEEKIQQNNLHNKVVFHGRKDKHEVIKLLSEADAVIFPSKGETFGLALTEAMALEKPVVCSDLEVFREIVENGKNGLIAKSEDDFAEKILKIFSDQPFAKHLSQNARKTIIEKFSMEKMLEETVNYYMEVINKE